jgi:HK97 family phage prohead protease
LHNLWLFAIFLETHCWIADMKRLIPKSEENRDQFLARVVPAMVDAKYFETTDACHRAAAKMWSLEKDTDTEQDVVGQVVQAKMIIDRLEKSDGDDSEERTATFIASTGTVDRQGDVVDVDGWELAEFRKNPVLLFGHDSRALPIGRVSDIKVEDGKLMAKTEGVGAGVHEMADSVWSMVKNGFLNAVSVGFRALETEPRFDKDGVWQGYKFIRQELMELSIVPVPANPEAIVVARSYGAQQSDIQEMFDGVTQADLDALVRTEHRRRQLEIMRLKSGVSV